MLKGRIMTIPDNSAARHCEVEGYTRAWEVGTGLQISLPPGRYEVTGEEEINGSTYLHLSDRFRIPAEEIAA